MHYSRNKKRIIIKDDILCRQYYDDLSEVNHRQVLSLDNYSKCYYNHYMEQLVNTQAIPKLSKKSDKRFTSLQLQHTSETVFASVKYAFNIDEWDLGTEDFMQIDLLPQLPPSGIYENTITAIDIFSTYAFAYPVSNPTAVNTAKVIIDIMTMHVYLPTLIIADKG